MIYERAVLNVDASLPDSYVAIVSLSDDLGAVPGLNDNINNIMLIIVEPLRAERSNVRCQVMYFSDPLTLIFVSTKNLVHNLHGNGIT